MHKQNETDIWKLFLAGTKSPHREIFHLISMIECSSIFTVCWCLFNISNNRYLSTDLFRCGCQRNDENLKVVHYISFLPASPPPPPLLLVFVVSCDTDLFLFSSSFVCPFFFLICILCCIIITSFPIPQLDQCSKRFLFGYMMKFVSFRSHSFLPIVCQIQLSLSFVSILSPSRKMNVS